MTAMTDDTVRRRRERVFGAGAQLFYEQPLRLVRGEGVALFDADGRRYVDMYNNVPCTGHCHPHVVAAVREQVGLLNVHNRYLHDGIGRYAERLLGHLHDGVENIVFACSGTEAVDVALTMARLATGRRGIVCSDAAYHGNSAEVCKLTHCAATGGEIRGIRVPDVLTAPDNDVGGGDVGDAALEHLRAVLRDLERDGAPVAALIVCPIFANEGLPSPPRGFLGKAAALVRAAGGLVIADEVQAGLGRTGAWWGSEVAGIEPDIVVMGKPLGAGVPLSAAAASRAVVEGFRRATGYFNTFASSPLQAAAGNAVLDVIEGEDLRGNVAQVGAFLREGLEALRRRHPVLGPVRGHGLFLGVDWMTAEAPGTADRAGAKRAVNALKNKGFLLGVSGALGNMVKMRPPLVFSRADAQAFLRAFAETLDEAAG